MNAMSGSFIAAAEIGHADSAALAARWAALREAGAVIAALAGQDDPEPEAAERFAEIVGAAGGWRLERASQDSDDLCAIIETGLAALLAVHGQGGDPAPAARALWREFVAARAALLALAPPPPDRAAPARAPFMQRLLSKQA